MNASNIGPSLVPRLAYLDQRAAVDWLERAFGFEPVLVATDGNGAVIHAQMRFGNGRIHIGSEWGSIKAPGSAGGVNTQTIAVQLDSGLDTCCERARNAGGRILDEPKDQFHGDRTFRVLDPEGHIWCFSQWLREVSAAEMEAAVPGMKIWTKAGTGA